MSTENPPAIDGNPEMDPEGGKPDYTPPATQEDLNRIIETRLAQERKKYADYDDLKKKAGEHDAYLESQKDEHQKALDEARRNTETEVAQRFLDRLVTASAESVAASLGFYDPADAASAVRDTAEFVKDDEPDTDAIKTAIEKLASDKPYLVKATVQRPAGKPKPRAGERQSEQPKKGRAAAALRQLGAERRAS